MAFLQRLWQQLTQVWRGMSLSRKVLFSALTVLCVVVLGAVGYWISQSEYRVLYSELAPEDAGAVTAKLTAQNIPFRLTSGGTTILVPADQVSQLRLDLAMDGLPAKGSKGFELLDGSVLGMTPFMERVNYSRALQAELARTIMQIEPVAYARVHIVQPENSPFLRDKKPTTASVILKLKPRAALGRSVASGIVALVARSVEGLVPENVTLVDSSGKVLFDQHGSENGSVVPSSQFEYRREYEAYLANKAEEMLTQAFGAGRAVVRVTAELNFKSLTETRETYDLDQKAIKKEMIQNSKTAAATSPPRGTTGAGGRQATPAPPGTPDTSETSDIEYYAPPKTVQQRVDAAGTVERLTVAAMIDREATPNLNLTDAEDIIKRAVGYKQGRDDIKVTDVKLSGPAGKDEEMDGEWTQTQRLQSYASLARYGVIGLIALGTLGFGFLALKRLLPGPQAPGQQKPAERSDKFQAVASAAQRDPDAVARVLAGWLKKAETPERTAA